MSTPTGCSIRGLSTPSRGEICSDCYFFLVIMYSKTSRVSLVVLGRGTASAVPAVGIGSSGHSVPHILSSYRSGCRHHRRPSWTALPGGTHQGVAGHVIPAKWRVQPLFWDSRGVLAQHLRRPSAATAISPECAFGFNATRRGLPHNGAPRLSMPRGHELNPVKPNNAPPTFLFRRSCMHGRRWLGYHRTCATASPEPALRAHLGKAPCMRGGSRLG